jgi:signal transduction histidine kinase
MSPGNKKGPKVARRDTDASLRFERKRADDELSSRRASIEGKSDAVVDRARDRADEVLGAARDQADAALERTQASDLTQEAISRDRGVADEVLQSERAVADVQLAQERDEHAWMAMELLRLGRVATDQHLFVERARSDEAVLSRDDFMGLVAHDLRTLLAGIALNAGMIANGAPSGDETLLRRVRGIQRSTVRMNRLIGDLADIASIEAGKFSVAPETLDAVQLVRESVEAFQPSAAANGLTLDAEVPGGSLPAKADHERVIQVLANLLSNAIKFTPKGGRVSLRLDRADGWVRFAVSDTGPGIDPAKHELVFIRFWQAEKQDARGLGLGLYISKCIVVAHGGTISVDSKPGQGSTFLFTLPAA